MWVGERDGWGVGFCESPVSGVAFEGINWEGQFVSTQHDGNLYPGFDTVILGRELKPAAHEPSPPDCGARSEGRTR